MQMLVLQDLVKTKTQLVYLMMIMQLRDKEKFIQLTELPGKKKCH
jgi:hypothetical protein